MLWTNLVTVDRLEWVLFAVLGVSIIVTAFALFDTHRDRRWVQMSPGLSPRERDLLYPPARTACIHERFRLTKQAIAFVGATICIMDGRLLYWLVSHVSKSPDLLQFDLLVFQGIVVRVVLLLLALLMLATSLHSIYARRKYLLQRPSPK